MAIHGSLEEVPLPDVLQLLALGKKTGCLSLSDGGMQGRIYLDDGRVCDASVINRPDRLGDVLVKRGRITREQLNQAIALQEPRGDKTVGQLLVDSGQIARTEVERLVRTQVEEAVYFLFTWRRGDFTFTRDARPERRDFPLSIDAESLLLEGARRVDEWSVIQKKIPSFDLTFRLEKDPRDGGTHALSDEQQRLLPHLDGTRDVAALVDAAGMSEFDVGKALYGLITAGFARMVERRVRVRHLEQGQLLAYLVREGEFIDPARRRQAANHIADCAVCAGRLKTIHIRRTQEVPAPSEATTVVGAAPPSRAAAARSGSGWDGPERRTGTDRRKGDQRKGDRRRVQVMTWLAFNPERREAGRRAHERRLADRRGGRAPGDLRLVAGAAATLAPAPAPTVTLVPKRSSGGRSRGTGPRRQPGPLQRATPVPSEPVRPPIAPPVEPPAAKPPEAPPAAPKKADLAWLVTPDESLELIRKSRGVFVPRIPGTERKPATPAAPSPSPAPAPPRPTAAEAVPAAAPARTPAAVLRARRTNPAGRRWLAVAAVVTVMGGAAWLAQPLLRRPGAAVSGTAGAVVASPEAGGSPGTSEPGVVEPQQVVSTPLSDSAIAAPERNEAPPPAPRPAPPVAAVIERAPTPPPAPALRRDTVAVPVSQPPAADTRPPVETPAVAVVTAPPSVPPPVAAAPAPVPSAEPSADPPPAVETDPELLAGNWIRTSRSEAEAELGRGMVAVPGLPIASIARPGAGGRSGIRIVQTLESGDPLELVLTRPAFLNRGGAAGPDRVTAVRVAVLEGSGGAATGSARLGGYLINARARVPADELKALLARLAEPAR